MTSTFWEVEEAMVAQGKGRLHPWLMAGWRNLDEWQRWLNCGWRQCLPNVQDQAAFTAAVNAQRPSLLAAVDAAVGRAA